MPQPVIPPIEKDWRAPCALMRRRRRRRQPGPWRARVHAMIWAAQSRHILLMRGQDEVERCTAPLIAPSGQSSPVSFHDRAADRESHAHAAPFGGEEGVEQPVRILGGDRDAAIRHTYQHLLCLVLTR